MSAGKGTPKAARRSNEPPRQTRRQEAAVAEALSDRATLLLIRKTLCPETLSEKDRDDSQPIEELLPPLTSSNEIDLQIYAFLSIILRDFVQNWYNKITPDETFVLEIVQVIAHCTRALEERLRHIDLESLLLDEIPDLLDRHIIGELNFVTKNGKERRLTCCSVPNQPCSVCSIASASEHARSLPRSFPATTALTSTRPRKRR